MRRRLWILGMLLGCTRPVDPPPSVRAVDPPDRLEASPAPPSRSPSAAPPPSAASPPSAAPPPEPAPVALAARYPWLAADRAIGAHDRLEQRFRVPSGFARVPLAAGSFGAWLRGLPLEPAGTPVVSHRGEVILPPQHRHLATCQPQRASEQVVLEDLALADIDRAQESDVRAHG